VTLTIKKSSFATVLLALLVKAVSVSKFAVGAPEPYLTILVIVAPALVLVNVVASVPVACAVVKVIVPAMTDVNNALGVPSVEVRPLIDAPDKVATFELTVTSKRVNLTVASAAVT
jgi:hypothetical protein